MPKLKKQLPKYARSGKHAVVYYHGKRIYLGLFNSPESMAAYVRFTTELKTNSFCPHKDRRNITVQELVPIYLEHAQEYDRSHFSAIKTAVQIFQKNFVDLAVGALDSRSFLLLQEMFVKRGVSRQYCNTLMAHIRAMLKWGIIRKLVPYQIYDEAKLVPPLKKGKTRAPERLPRQPVPYDVFERTLPHLLPTLQGMVQVQYEAIMRPNEVCRMKVGEIDRNFKTNDGTVIWMYTPGIHKNSWREKNQRGEYVRIIPLGKLEQDIIAPRLVGKSDEDYVFSPKDAMKEHYALRATKRKTKAQPSQVKRKELTAKNPKRKDRDHYDRNSYGHAIKRMITIANKSLPEGEKIPHWFPYQLRHTAITNIVLQTGSLDIARAAAGQKTISVTQDYNHADVKIAIEQAVQRSR
jgi:integrase